MLLTMLLVPGQTHHPTPLNVPDTQHVVNQYWDGEEGCLDEWRQREGSEQRHRGREAKAGLRKPEELGVNGAEICVMSHGR